MTAYLNIGIHDLPAQTETTGAQIACTPATGGNPTGCLLPAGTYYFELGTDAAPMPAQCSLVSAHLAWSAALAATFTIETSNFPAFVGGAFQGQPDVSVFAASSGTWIQQNAPDAYVPVFGTGNSAVAAVVTAGGTNAGGCELALELLSSRRVRIKAVVTVAGYLRVNPHGKAGA